MLARWLARRGYIHYRALSAHAARQTAAVALQHHAREASVNVPMTVTYDMVATAVEASYLEAKQRVLDGRL